MPDRIETLLQFLRETPADPFLQHALALEYIKAGRDPEAGEIFKLLLEREPGYVGSYYHYAKLLERMDERKQAIGIYEKGMDEARKAGDGHALSELQAAYEDLI